MTDHEASRTLVKSPPELWAECSDAASLARHLGEFGEIKITRLEPETQVEWEAELACGTVRIEPSAWGTRVTLTAQLQPPPASAGPEAGVEVAPVPEPGRAAPEPELIAPEPEPMALEPEPAAPEPPGPDFVQPEPLAAPPRGFLARLRIRFASPSPGPAARQPERVAPEPEPAASETPPESSEPEVARHEPLLAAAPETPPESEPARSVSLLDTESALSAALDSLGQAHHRPFSRS